MSHREQCGNHISPGKIILLFALFLFFRGTILERIDLILLVNCIIMSMCPSASIAFPDNMEMKCYISLYICFLTLYSLLISF